MGHAHAHDQAHPHGYGPAHAASRRRLATVLGLTWGYLGVEVVAGVVTGSLALLADAGHMLTDVAGLVLALAAMKFAERPPSPRRTYGYQRVEILAAAANGVALLGVAGYVLREAWLRLHTPHPVASLEVLAVASVGLLVNLAGAVLLRSGSRQSLNLRGAYNEVVADAVSSVGVILGAGVMRATGWYWVDPAVAAAIAVWILPRTYHLLREALHVLLEGAPRDVDLGALRATMEAVPGVRKVHDLHVWTLTSGIHALSAHAIVGDHVAHEEVLLALRARVTTEFPISHLTVQLEEHCCGDHAHDRPSWPD